jgi:hypothetical protein
MNLKKIKQELLDADFAENIEKDILIVVHNQYDYIKNCIKSIFENTDKFNLFIWNNNSDDQTSEYLNKINKKYDNIKLYESKENLGFIIPNNRMIKDTNSPYIILLNSDTIVSNLWDKVLIGSLENNKEVAISGFCGGILDKEGKGYDYAFGFDCDYICGYCMCFPKAVYQEFGLFDEENLKFAYFEDSDFSLRVKEKNRKIYACHSHELVHHFGNKTTFELLSKNKFPFPEIENNSNYFKKRWAKYLSKK